ncbi:uncharacterized protein UTRI_00420 [Ustilago trichophora]|uniref:MOSC domain-containing protein n=1 Tax=Ustilago trichophora TaxID=86804 RepID=A0A5C3DR81_9BASI|nr:uncharacterized protein UTRI_00420 [Ustilago trichophora]
MPAKIPFFDSSASLQQKWRESASSGRLTAQLYVFILLIAVGLLRHYLFPSSKTSQDGTFGSAHAPHFDGAKDETLGEIDEIFIYPIKSCAGVSVGEATLTGQGFDLDRRWMVVKASKEGGKLDKISLREEPRLTLIQPVIDEGANRLRLKLTDVGEKEEKAKRTGRDLGESETVLRPSEAELKSWKQVPTVEMYGDYADGRVAALPSGSRGKLSPSEWISEFLGYPVHILHFDTTSSVARKAFPIFKPPTDATSWSVRDRTELHRSRGIEFQDEYPLLVASHESLLYVRSQLSSALSSSDNDGRGGRAIAGLDSTKWSDANALSMARFRPNIVFKGTGPAFSEDSWERIWILPRSNETEKDNTEGAKAMLQLVARCQRCLLTAVDPITAEKDPSVPLKLLNRSRMRVKKVEGVEGGNGRAGPCFGMYAVPLPLSREGRGESEGEKEGEGVKYGALKKGDAIRVRWRPFELDDEPERRRTAQ